MDKYESKRLKFEGIFIIEYPTFGDSVRNSKKLFDNAERNIFSDLSFKPSESMLINSKQGVLRGMHYQSYESKRQNRLVYVISGNVYVVVADINEERSTYGSWDSLRITAEDNTCVYIPGDYALGTLACTDSSMLVFYDGTYEAGYDAGFRYDDDMMGISWEMSNEKICVAEKDLRLPSFQKRRK